MSSERAPGVKPGQYCKAAECPRPPQLKRAGFFHAVHLWSDPWSFRRSLLAHNNITFKQQIFSTEEVVPELARMFYLEIKSIPKSIEPI
jgi:hypothetical protein